jgi:3-hydroxyanthranilate 3,4-dioxygenase
MRLAPPIALQAWIEENRSLLQPPVGNVAIWNSDFLVMVIGGPNARSDFHINPGEELFYQVEGDIALHVMDEGGEQVIPIRQGELFLLPARVPHSPRRPAGTVGLVVEQPKAFQEDHLLRWYCGQCGAVVYDHAFQPVDIGAQIKAALATFRGDEGLRTCQACGAVHPG